MLRCTHAFTLTEQNNVRYKVYVEEKLLSFSGVPRNTDQIKFVRALN